MREGPPSIAWYHSEHLDKQTENLYTSFNRFNKCSERPCQRNTKLLRTIKLLEILRKRTSVKAPNALDEFFQAFQYLMMDRVELNFLGITKKSLGDSVLDSE